MQDPVAAGKFIVLEGIDGSGITTQVESLRIWFERRGLPVYATKEPTRGLLGGIINEALDHEIRFAPDVMALLFAADRLNHLSKKIVPELAKGRHVICDRFILSGLAYQSLESDLDWLRSVNSKCLQPDVTVFLDIPVPVSMTRSRSDVWRSEDQVQLYEGQETLELVRTHFLSTIDLLRGEGQRIEIVDGTQGIAAINAAVSGIIASVLGDHQTSSGHEDGGARSDIESMILPDR